MNPVPSPESYKLFYKQYFWEILSKAKKDMKDDKNIDLKPAKNEQIIEEKINNNLQLSLNELKSEIIDQKLIIENLKKQVSNKDEINEMIESALRRHNRRSTIISSVLGWILIGGYSFGLFQAVQNV